MPRSSLRAPRRVRSRTAAPAFTRTASLLLTLCACSAGPETAAAATEPLRISSSMGLAPITPEVDRSISASVKGLVCVDAAQFLTPNKSDADHVTFKIQPGKGVPPETLAQALRGPGIAEAHVENGLLVAQLKPGAQAPPMPFTCLDIGPYRQASYSPERLVLARRSGHGMETIE